MLSSYDQERDNKEAKRITILAKEIIKSEEGKELLHICRNHFDAYTPSSVVSDFDPNRTFFNDGIKAAYLFMEDLANGILIENIETNNDE